MRTVLYCIIFRQTMNFLDTLKQINRFGKHGGSVVGIDIGSSAIKIVELEERHGKPTLSKYGTLAVGPYAKTHVGTPVKLSPIKLEEAIRTAFKAIGIQAKRGALAIPLKLSLIVTIDFPLSVADKLDQVVPIEARKYIPLPLNEVNIAWTIASAPESKSMNAPKETKEEEKIKILVAAIQNTTILDYQNIATNLGLQPVTLEIETFSAMRSISRPQKEIYALLDVGAEDSKIVVHNHGSITSSHTINKGSYAITQALSSSLGVSFKEAEHIKRKYGLIGEYNGKNLQDIIRPELEYIFSEARRVIDSFKEQFNKTIESVVLIGGGSTLQGISPFATELCGKTIVLGDAFGTVELPTPALRDVLKESGPEYAVALGLAMRILKE